MSTTHSSLLITLGGLALFMYGMSLASENLQKLAANRIREIITTLAKRPIWGVVLGIILTILLQSSGAVTSMLVGLGSARVISLPQVMSVILGSAIGSTFTVQVISFNVAQYGLMLFVMSFFVYFMSRQRTLTTTMAVGMGFGLIFWGMELISHGTEQLRHVQVFASMLQTMKENPFYAIGLTAIFTALVQSSAITIGFAMSLATADLINLNDAVYWVLGANVGTTATALVASIGGNYVGRQVAWAHCFYKITSMLIFVPFVDQLSELVSGDVVGRSIANTHTILNVMAAIIYYPFVKKGAALVEKFFPPSHAEKEYSVKYIHKSDWESPSVVLAHAERELMRMSDIVQSMLLDSLRLFRKEDTDLIESIRRRDDRVDLLNREISLYLAQHLEEAPNPIQLGMMRVMSFSADLESAADVIDNMLLDLASKKHNQKVDFSDEGWSELEEIYQHVTETVTLSISCFQRQDHDLARQVLFQKRNIRKLEKRFRESHISRLVKGRPETIVTSSIHMDVLGEYRRIVGLLAGHVYSLVKEGDELKGVTDPDRE
ncbi:MAG: Na/Pi cotransporter family protein [Bdellovibrionales bacterium]